MGDKNYANVRMANLMVNRLALLARLGISRFIVLFLEQPHLSIMARQQRLAQEPLASLCCIRTWAGTRWQCLSILASNRFWVFF